ncbi:hypothetical protein [Streptomyces fumanus]|uniref:hypothetical protein n=1 Tax=Streptomyces fumanus TaxID=67302 RepID=UPI0033EC3B09
MSHDYNAYHRGCRCGVCREANRVYAAKQRARRAADPTAADAAGHGKATTYINCGCRCDACRTANSTAVRERRQRRTTGGAS